MWHLREMRLSGAEVAILDFLVAQHDRLSWAPIDLLQIAEHMELPPWKLPLWNTRNILRVMSQKRLVKKINSWPKSDESTRCRRRLDERRECFLLASWLPSPSGWKALRQSLPKTPQLFESTHISLEDFIDRRQQTGESLHETGAGFLRFPRGFPLAVQIAILSFLVGELTKVNPVPTLARQIAKQVNMPEGPTLKLLAGLLSGGLVKRLGKDRRSPCFIVSPALFSEAGLKVWRQLFPNEQPTDAMREDLAECLNGQKLASESKRQKLSDGDADAKKATASWQ